MPTKPFTVIVPARLPSTRLPNKPLADIAGTPMLIRVLQQAVAANAEHVVAAVAEQTLADAVTAAGFNAVLTGEHDSGSSRVAAAAETLALADDHIVVNVQGDEPFIEPELINAVAQLAANNTAHCATAARPLTHDDDYHNPAVVKVVGDNNNNATYFSRAAIPHQRSGGVPALARVHLGIYAYRVGALQHFMHLPACPTEKIEQLEQLRILWHGGSIALLEYPSKSFGIDTAEDLARACQHATTLAANTP